MTLNDELGNTVAIFSEDVITICDWKNEVFYISNNFYRRVPERDGMCQGCALAFDKGMCDIAQSHIGCVCEDLIFDKII